MIWLQIYYKKKPLPYLINEFGKILSIGDKSFLKYRRVEYDKDGYAKIALRINKKSKKFFIHRLVAMMFCEGYDEEKVVNHKDGNKQNNHYSNLEWVYSIENEHHASIHNLKAINERNSRCKYSNKIVSELCQLLANGWSIEHVSEYLSIPYSYVWEVRNGKVRQRISKDYTFPSSTTNEITERFEVIIL